MKLDFDGCTAFPNFITLFILGCLYVRLMTTNRRGGEVRFLFWTIFLYWIRICRYRRLAQL